MCDVNCHGSLLPWSRINILEISFANLSSVASSPKCRRDFTAPFVLARSFLFKYLAPCCFSRSTWWASFSRFAPCSPFFSRSPSLVLDPASFRAATTLYRLLLLSRTRSNNPLPFCPFSMKRQVLYSPTLQRRLPLPSGKEGNESETVRQCSAPTFRSRCLSSPLAFFPLSLSLSLFSFLRLPSRHLSLCLSILAISFSVSHFLSLSLPHPFVTFASPISLSSLHARASFPSYRPAAAILLPPF